MAERTERGRAGGKRRFTVESLFADTRPQAVGVTDLVEAKEIHLDRIEPDPDQPRRTFDDERLEELAASIRLEGVLQPIVVRYERDRDIYIVVHGERRWRASRLAGRGSIPALVREVPEERRLVQQLMENIVRDDLNALDRAAALRTLKAQLEDAPWELVAEAVGIRRSRLFQLLSTEKLPEAAQDDIRAGRLSEKQSRVLHGLPPVAREALRQALVQDAIPQNEANALARALRDLDPPDDPEDMAALLDELRRDIQEQSRNQSPSPTRRGAGSAPTAPDEPIERPDGARGTLADLAEACGRYPHRYDSARLEREVAALAATLAAIPSENLRFGQPARQQLSHLVEAVSELLAEG